MLGTLNQISYETSLYSKIKLHLHPGITSHCDYLMPMSHLEPEVLPVHSGSLIAPAYSIQIDEPGTENNSTISLMISLPQSSKVITHLVFRTHKQYVHPRSDHTLSGDAFHTNLAGFSLGQKRLTRTLNSKWGFAVVQPTNGVPFVLKPCTTSSWVLSTDCWRDVSVWLSGREALFSVSYAVVDAEMA